VPISEPGRRFPPARPRCPAQLDRPHRVRARAWARVRADAARSRSAVPSRARAAAWYQPRMLPSPSDRHLPCHTRSPEYTLTLCRIAAFRTSPFSPLEDMVRDGLVMTVLTRFDGQVAAAYRTCFTSPGFILDAMNS